jgi:hypothetical protein
VVVRVMKAPVAAVAGTALLADSVPVAGQVVNFVIVNGGGHVFAGSGTTNAAGEVRDLWTLGTVAGAQVLEARAVDDAGNPIVFDRVTAVADPGPAVNLTVRAMDDTAAVGDTWELRKRVITAAWDQFGNLTDDYTLGYTLWVGDEAGDPVEVPGESVTFDKPFDGWLYLWVNGTRAPTGSLRLHVLTP